jgi:hypothetical protein
MTAISRDGKVLLVATVLGGFAGAVVVLAAAARTDRTIAQTSMVEAQVDTLSRKIDGVSDSLASLRGIVVACREASVARLEEGRDSVGRNTSAAPLADAAAQALSEEPVNPESVRALEEAQRVLDRAIGEREWGPRQVQDFRIVGAHLTASQRVQMLHKIVDAVNSGELRLKGAGPMF